jgi:hypothetical protein
MTQSRTTALNLKNKRYALKSSSVHWASNLSKNQGKGVRIGTVTKQRDSESNLVDNLVDDLGICRRLEIADLVGNLVELVGNLVADLGRDWWDTRSAPKGI